MEDFLKRYKAFMGVMVSLLETIKSTVNKLSNVPVLEWWSTALAIDDKEFKRLLALLGYDFPSKEKENIIEEIQGHYLIKKKLSKEMEMQLNDDEKVLSSYILPPSSALYRFFKGKRKERYSEQDLVHHVFLYIWVNYRSILAGFTNSIVMKTADSPNISSLIQNTIEFINKSFPAQNSQSYNSLLNAMSYFGNASDENIKIQEYNIDEEIRIAQDCQNKVISSEQIEELNNNETIKNIITSLSPDIFLKENFDYFIGTVDFFFALLNTDLLGVDSMEMTEFLRELPAKDLIQKGYDLFCSKHSGLTRNYVFVETIHTILKSEDFEWEAPRSSSCFNISWHRLQIQDLYDSLVGKYLNKRTDIRSFCFFLTGCKPKALGQHGAFEKKIVWIGEDIQSAALFLGKMKELDSRGEKIKWSMIPTIILKEKELTLHSSTQYKQALQSKALGNGKYSDLLQAIEKIKQKKYERGIMDII